MTSSTPHIMVPSLDVVKHLHAQGLYPGGAAGLRDAGALEGALAGVEMAVTYADLDIISTAILVAERLVKAHAFADGNKRTAALSFLATLAMNGYEWTADPRTLTDMVIKAAQTGKMDHARAHCRKAHVAQLLFNYDAQGA